MNYIPLATLDRWLLSTLFEKINDNIRLMYRNVDHEIKLITQFIVKKLVNIDDSQIILLKLEKAVDRLHSLQQIINESDKIQEAFFNALTQRINLLKSEPNLQNMQQDPKFSISDNNVRKRVTWTLIEFLNRRGYINTARKLSERENMDNLVDLELFAEVKRISDHIKSGNFDHVLSWIELYKHKLNKLQIPLEDNVMAQRMLTAAANNDMEQLVKLIRQSGSGITSSEIKKAITQSISGTDNIDNKERLNAVLKMFESAVAQVHGYGENPVVYSLLHAGFSAMKSKGCRDCRAVSCPSCCPDWAIYVEQVPTLHRLQSVLVCPVTGQVMDDSNPPMASPDGIVYSNNALKYFTEDGIVTCPKTGHKHSIGSYTKLFIT